jgi:hypothetical protein
MKPQVNLVKLALCGPSDVAKEIDIAKAVVEEWNFQHGEASGFWVKHQHWSTDSHPEDIQRADEVATIARRCLTVENETSFEELAKLRSGELLVQTSYPGSGTLALVHRLPVTMEFWHFGDSDEAGFDILRVLRDKSGRDIESLHMERGRIPFEQESLGRPTKPTWPFYERPRQN